MEPPPLHITMSSPVLYGLNPRHHDINSLGLRDDEVSVAKPDGTLRILVLGDSVAYGPGVAKHEAFPNRLEQLLRNQYGKVEVLNASVSGYTAYNELQYYLTTGRKFGADIVMVAFCLNDIVNPRLHWGGYTKKKIVDIPDDAIPNLEYDKEHVLPRMEEAEVTNPQKTEHEKSVIEHSALYNVVKSKLPGLLGAEEKPNIQTDSPPPQPRRAAESQRPSKAPSNVPTYLTGEDSLSIEVLLDRTTPEWRWLASIYDRLNDAVKAEGAILMIAMIPLAYQLDPGYPYLPQQQLSEYCEENGVFCVDLLPALKQHPKGDVFFLNDNVHYDIWHLKRFGHEICAEELLRQLEEIIPLTSPAF
jgi:lysophospholipase L1-like esterase